MESEDLGDVLEGHVDDVVGVLLDRLEVRERVALVELEAGLETGIGPIYIFMIVNGKVHLKRLRMRKLSRFLDAKKKQR